jgi:small subunit ribosomal protein S14
MAKKSMVEKNKRRGLLIEKYAEARKKLTAIVKDPSATLEDKFKAQELLAKLPRNSCKTRYRNRCALTGRSRGYYGFFKLCRLELRRLALKGELPGVKKASW